MQSYWKIPQVHVLASCSSSSSGASSSSWRRLSSSPSTVCQTQLLRLLEIPQLPVLVSGPFVQFLGRGYRPDSAENCCAVLCSRCLLLSSTRSRSKPSGDSARCGADLRQSCHVSWGNSEGDTALDGVEPIVASCHRSCEKSRR